MKRQPHIHFSWFYIIYYIIFSEKCGIQLISEIRKVCAFERLIISYQLTPASILLLRKSTEITKGVESAQVFSGMIQVLYIMKHR
ncbi:hypothetical protein FKM82_020637 [Ascaphus truei]